jgi:excisionase family DNA binding protein
MPRPRPHLTAVQETKPPRWARLDLAAEYADVHPMTLRRWAAAGRLPMFKFGRGVRVDLNDIDALMRRVPSSGGAA